MKYTDIMIDIETLSSSPRAAVIQIGACAFNLRTGDIGPTFSKMVKPDLKHTEISVSTVCWWLEQNEEARRVAATCLRDGVNEMTALSMLTHFVHETGAMDLCVWAMPPEFDLVILRNLADSLGYTLPWHFAATRDLRTLEYIAGGSKDLRVKPDVAHDAAKDAEAQAKTAVAYYKRWMQMRAET